MRSVKLIRTLDTDEECASFGREFWQEFLKAGYGTYSKGDLQDLILFLANRHAQTHFLEEASNYQLARLLKIPEAKVKSVRLNIAVKFEQDEGNAILKRLLTKVRDGKVRLADEGTVFSLVVENIVERRELEQQLKSTGGTCEYGQNREIVKIPKHDFFEVLKEVSGQTDDDLLEAFARHLKRAEFRTKAGNVFKKIRDAAGDITKDILKDVIKELLAGHTP